MHAAINMHDLFRGSCMLFELTSDAEAVLYLPAPSGVGLATWKRSVSAWGGK